MIVPIKLSLKFVSVAKLSKVNAVLIRYRSVVNKYIRHMWVNGGGLDKATADAIPCGHLSFRMRAHALQQAIGIVLATRRSAYTCGVESACPVFKGAMTLSKQLLIITEARVPGKFDLWLRFSTLSPRNRIDIPVKATKHMRKLLALPGAYLKTGGIIGEKGNKYFVVLWIELPDLPDKTVGTKLGIDVGLNKLIATSDNKVYGVDMKEYVARVRRRKPGSKGKLRACRARDQYINETLNQLPWNELSLVAVEKLTNLKKGKKPGRGKSFRKALAPWTYAYVLKRIELKARMNRVRRVEVSPSYTSQICPKCTHRARSNRVNEKFMCMQCGYTADADYVGSVNILARAVGESMVLQPYTTSNSRQILGSNA